VEVIQVFGVLTINVPPPPADRIWWVDSSLMIFPSSMFKQCSMLRWGSKNSTVLLLPPVGSKVMRWHHLPHLRFCSSVFFLLEVLCKQLVVPRSIYDTWSIAWQVVLKSPELRYEAEERCKEICQHAAFLRMNRMIQLRFYIFKKADLFHIKLIWVIVILNPDFK
jgi:hypothetical protein